MAGESIVENQRCFFKKGHTKSIKFRIQQLKSLKKMFTENSDAFCSAIYADIHRSKAQSYCFELAMILTEIDYMLEKVLEWAHPQTTAVQILDTPMIYKEPLGVVLIIGPWNYPISMLFLPLVAAIAAGNTAILKPSEISSNCSTLVAKLVANYFVPELVMVVEGGVKETTDLLDKRFDHIFYTGAHPVGRIVMQAAARFLTPITLELGGKCPVVIEDDADLVVTARRVAWGKWLNCGQTCLAPDHVFVPRRIKQVFVRQLQTALNTFYGGDPATHGDYARIVSDKHFSRLASLLDSTKGKVLIGGQKNQHDLYISPTVLDVNLNDCLMRDEIFGPILPIITVDNLNEAIEIINEGEKPLATYIFTNDKEKINRFIDETSSGGITVNDVLFHLSVDTLPFGGVGQSGMGRYRGKFGFDTFSNEKAVLKRRFFGESLMSFRYPPYTEKKFAQLRAMVAVRRPFPKILRLFRFLPLLLIGIFVAVFFRLIRMLRALN